MPPARYPLPCFGHAPAPPGPGYAKPHHDAIAAAGPGRAPGDRMLGGSSHLHVAHGVSPVMETKMAAPSSAPVITHFMPYRAPTFDPRTQRYPHPAHHHHHHLPPSPPPPPPMRFGHPYPPRHYSSPSSSLSPSAMPGPTFPTLPNYEVVRTQHGPPPHDQPSTQPPPPPPSSLPQEQQRPRHHHQQQQQLLQKPQPLEPQSGRKRSRNAWPAEMTRQIINVLLSEFLHSPTYHTNIYRSREERDHRFPVSGRTILEEYNKIQNVRRRYFIPLSYLLQWDQMRSATNGQRSRQRAAIEKKLGKPLERTRLELIFGVAAKPAAAAASSASGGGAAADRAQQNNNDNDDNDDNSNNNDDEDGEEDAAGKPVFELDIFVTELKRRDPMLWGRGVAAFQAWVTRKCSVNFIINH
ncbi:hypothetical protein H4R18_001237 [Coemansia javaensis]|uniref:Uncharacterized protein n=1 Tax=Coemansia javaensis TaxID=2761396 RepID=A0A9W8HM61_9FUNG|nr:hypothetical protein H4R18_001237 [Coemansia javaensis]